MWATILGSCLVGAILVAILGLILWRMIKAKKAGKSISCGKCCGCSGGSSQCSGCSSHTDPTTTK